MVLEADELAKFWTVMELSNSDGDIGHHSDGTTESLVHWNTHILKLDIDGENNRLTLGVQPVPSGKACHTIEALQKHFDELREVADLMEVQYSKTTFSVSRITWRISDGAANELAVGKILMEEKRKLCKGNEDWNQLSEKEEERVKMCVFTCESLLNSHLTLLSKNLIVLFL